jgi:hypothetical protein
VTVVPAEAVAAVLLPFSFFAGALGYRWQKNRSKRDGHVVAETVPRQRLPRQVNRQAARSAVLSKDWAKSDHQTLPYEDPRMVRPAMHRAEP